VRTAISSPKAAANLRRMRRSAKTAAHPTKPALRRTSSGAS
jgi:hypothetical protein